MMPWRSDPTLMARCFELTLQKNIVAAAWVLEQTELEAESLGLTL